jgi:hypothetical protein
LIQPELGHAAFVIDQHRHLVGHGALDVLNADVIAEDGARIAVGFFDWRAGEADVNINQEELRLLRKFVSSLAAAGVR